MSAFLSAFLASFSAFLSFFAVAGSAGVEVAGSVELRDVAARDLVTASTLASDRATAGRASLGLSFRGSLYSYLSAFFLKNSTLGISLTSERAIGCKSPRS